MGLLYRLNNDFSLWKEANEITEEVKSQTQSGTEPRSVDCELTIVRKRRRERRYGKFFRMHDSIPPTGLGEVKGATHTGSRASD